MKSFKEKIQDFDTEINERIDVDGHNYAVNITQLEGVMKHLGASAADAGYFVGKDNGREATDLAKTIISLVKKLRRG